MTNKIKYILKTLLYDLFYDININFNPLKKNKESEIYIQR